MQAGVRWWSGGYLVALCATSGCGVQTDLWLPIHEDARALLLVVEGANHEIFALDLDVHEGRSDLTMPEETTALYALYYPCSLAGLSLQPGKQRLTTVPSTGRPVPIPATLSSADISEGEAAPWSEEAELPMSLRKLRLDLPPLSPCPDWDVVGVDIPDTSKQLLIGAVHLQGQEVVAVTGQGQVLRVTPQEVIPWTRLSTASRYASVAKTPSGEILVGAVNGHILGAMPGEEFQERTPLPSSGGSDMALAVSAIAEERIWAWTSSLSLQRFDGNSWSTVGQVADVKELDGNNELALAWLAADEVIALASSYGGLVFRYRNGRFYQEHFAEADLEIKPMSVMRHQAFGAVLGDYQGRIFAEDGGGWVQLGDPPALLRARGLAPAGAGLIAGGIHAQFSLYLPDHGFCELATADSQAQDINQLVEVDGGHFVLPRFVKDSDIHVNFIFPREREGCR